MANTSQPEFALSSAFDGVNFLIGIRGNATSPDAVGAQLLSPTGTRVGSFINTGRLMDGFLDGPRVAFGGGNYLLVWTDAASQHPASGNDVYGQFISPAGAMVGSVFPVSTASGDQYARGVASDGANYLVIWAAGDGLRGRRISPVGQLLGAELVFTAQEVEEAAAVASGGGQYLVAWVEGTDGAHAAKGRLVSASGVLGDVLLLSQNNSHFHNPISVAYGAGRFMVVWHHNADADADWDLRGRIVLPNGIMVGDELVLAAGPNDDQATASSVVFDGQYFLVVWADWVGDFATGQGTVLGRYWSPSGEPVGAVFTIDGTQAKHVGIGLSAGQGKVLVIINTDILDARSGPVREVHHPPLHRNSARRDEQCGGAF